MEFVVDGTQRKIGRIVEIYEDKAVIQVFEGSENMSLKNTHTKLTGHPMEIALSPDILGRTFNGIGNPIDGLGPIAANTIANFSSEFSPLNPVKREYPRNYIRTGISPFDEETSRIASAKDVISVKITRICIFCSNARYSAAVNATFGVIRRSTTGSFARFKNMAT